MRALDTATCVRRLLGVGLLIFSGAAARADDAQDWLARMNEALTTRNYDGTFMHIREGRVESLRIIHRVENGEVRERLVSLDGSGREFVRNGAELTCYLPDQQTVLVERRPQDGPLLGNLPRFDASTAAFYDVRSGERLRLMGRDARLVSVTPRDEYRYGYRLWIDEKTAMPLKTQLCDGSGKVIEQIVFSSLALPSRIPDSAFQPQVAAEGFRWLRDESLGSSPTPVVGAGAVMSWTTLRLPPGFRMTSRGHQTLPGSGSPATHLVFSDGIASVSVFVEAQGATTAPLRGAANVGSSAAYSTQIDGHQVTAVGEVPARTVRFIASQVRTDNAAGSSMQVAGSRPALRRPVSPARPGKAYPALPSDAAESRPAPAFAPGESKPRQ